MNDRLTHIDEHGRARMVDVGDKQPSRRSARARARLRMTPAAATAVRDGSGPKGEVLTVARLAGIQAAKQTAGLIPLAHPLPLTFVDVDATVDASAGVVTIEAEARTTAETGVEMEAMTAVAVAALTVYDMVKGLERGIEIEQVVLLEKHGGRSDYSRQEPGPDAPSPSAALPGAEGGAGVVERRRVPRERAPMVERGSPKGAALVTISTSKAAGHGTDESGPRLRALAEQLGLEVISEEILGDERRAIEIRLRQLSEQHRCALVLTSGGTGVAPGDVTPEATLAVIEREIDGLAEAMRLASKPHTPNWMLSRGVVGVRDGTLIVNLPGSPKSIEQIGEQIGGALTHALALIAGEDPGHGG
ncbi:MAG: cyclic pyranopterin monophosphate synthase [Solirubrobacteraceae bacterium]|nr:cyclic pyranopterin monophosphate synthase [Solirubrobacteraceae bacterium]